jgi:hypothetical protein
MAARCAVMTNTTFDPGHGVRMDRTDVRPATAARGSDRPRRASPDGETRGLRLVLAGCLFAFTWLVLLRDVRVGLPGSTTVAPRGAGAVAGRPLEGGPPVGSRPPVGPPHRGARGVAEFPK